MSILLLFILLTSPLYYISILSTIIYSLLYHLITMYYSNFFVAAQKIVLFHIHQNFPHFDHFFLSHNSSFSYSMISVRIILLVDAVVIIPSPSIKASFPISAPCALVGGGHLRALSPTLPLFRNPYSSSLLWHHYHSIFYHYYFALSLRRPFYFQNKLQ